MSILFQKYYFQVYAICSTCNTSMQLLSPCLRDMLCFYALDLFGHLLQFWLLLVLTTMSSSRRKQAVVQIDLFLCRLLHGTFCILAPCNFVTSYLFLDRCSFQDQDSVSFSVGYPDIQSKSCIWDDGCCTCFVCWGLFTFCTSKWSSTSLSAF